MAGRVPRRIPGGGAGRAPVVAIVGPTATGKTAVAIEVARRLGGEIVSADSRQAYRGLEIGTAAPDTAERVSVPHHGVGFLEPSERYGAGRFARLARGWIAAIEARGARPVIAGGTGLFLRALLDPVFREPELDATRRDRLRGRLEKLEAKALARWAGRLDPELARRLPRLDRQRAARAVEVALLTGRPLSWWQVAGPRDHTPLAARVYVLHLPADLHRGRIAVRAARLLEAGWEEEVRDLLRAGHDEGSPALDAVGYRRVLALVRGEIGRGEALAAIERDTWRYARRQRTWFRHQLPPEAVRLDARQPVGQLAGRIAGECAPPAPAQRRERGRRG